MIDPDFMDEAMDWHASMTHDTDYMEMLAESEGQRTIFHERVKATQSRLAQHVAEVPPSAEADVYWLYAHRNKGRYPDAGDDSGKWLIFAPPDEIDAAWLKVKKLTESGKLGSSSKVSTRKGNEGRDHVICVYTYDWTDKEDCMAIRETLRAAGFTQPLSYKSDEDTLAGRYASKGHRVAKYHV
jgi:hypothetical protein